MVLNDLSTPALILDLDRVERNCERMIDRATRLGVQLRPHMKTAKCAEIGKLATSGRIASVTVSTLAEVEYFACEGFRDITYAVGIAAHKLPTLARLQREYSVKINLLLDAVDTVGHVARGTADLAECFPVFIEIDCGGGRGGIPPESQELITIAQALRDSAQLSLAGVLTHAGHSYAAKSRAEIADIAERERGDATRAASLLRVAGFEVPIVSIGSTPTAMCAASLEGVTEMRPGVYTLFDLDQASLGVCSVDDIAASVLTTVIGHNQRSLRMLIDAGALALSKDLSAANRSCNIGYGIVFPQEGGSPIADMYVDQVHQEHGFVAHSHSFDALRSRYPVGTRLRVLPNHACMTVAPYDQYYLVRGDDQTILGSWGKVSGWSSGKAS